MAAKGKAALRAAKSKAPPRAAKSKAPLRAAKSKAPLRAAKSSPAAPPDVATLLAELEHNGSEPFRADMSARYGIVTADRVFGTPMAKIKQIAKGVGHDHQLAEALWKTGVYEARMLASLVDDPERVTPSQMARWSKDFDNWAVVDTLCFNLFDRSPHAFAQVDAWSKSKKEFVRRAAFALLASLALHRHGTDDDFLRALPLILSASTDERNFVKKGVSWALRAIGRKKSRKLQVAARALATQLAATEDASARWIGKDALKDFAKTA